MTIYYVGAGGSDAAAGTSWATRKLTLNGAEDIPVVAGDTVYVGPGTYRELLTVDVSGSSGNLITYIGDYTGANTDGTGGVVRITGSDNDQTVTRASCISSSPAFDYRQFTGFVMDMCSSNIVNNVGGSHWTIDECMFGASSGGASTPAIFLNGAQTNCTISQCIFQNGYAYGVSFSHSSTVSDAAHVIQNCIFLANSRAVNSIRVGGATVKNCLFYGVQMAVRIGTALAGGQTITVNNCVMYGTSSAALWALSTGEITEDYNSFFGNASDRTNVSTGSNSNAYPPIFDKRWFFEAINGGTMVTPFDLASYSQLVELNSGTGAPSADLRGTTVQGSFREWGPLEYDSTLDIEAGAGGSSVYRRVARLLGG